ncbi:MAG: phage holin family protein [Gemmatimonadota bacterium]|nr:phage holin family protein [Gemmatimonadota bacterium]
MGARSAGGAPRDGSFGELLGELTDASAQLVRDEVRLVRAETVESLAALKHGVVVLGVAIVLGLGALGTALACAVMVLAEYVLDGRTWLAALLVAVVFGIVAFICAWRGASSLSGAKLAPRETAESIKETAKWLKHPTKSAAR